MGKFRKLKIVTVGLTVILAAGLISGCGGGNKNETEASESTTIPMNTMPNVTTPNEPVAQSTPAVNETIPFNPLIATWNEPELNPPKLVRVKLTESPELNVRSGPGGDADGYTIVSKIPNGTVVSVNKTAKDGSWYRLTDTGYYVKAEFFEDVADEMPPIVDDPADTPTDTQADSPSNTTAAEPVQ